MRVMTNQCVLYAEDDPNDAFLLQHAFATAEIPNPLQIVTDGQAAIDYLAGTGAFADRSRYPRPGLVLLDIKLPRQTGLEVLAWLRAQPNLHGLPVIMFSASGRAGDVAQASRLGANAYVVKPATIEDRLEFARAVRTFWLHFHHPPDNCAGDEIPNRAPCAST